MRSNEDKLRLRASVFQAYADRMWARCERHVEQLEKVVEILDDAGDDNLRDLVALVVIQIYLNKITRGLEDV